MLAMGHNDRQVQYGNTAAALITSSVQCMIWPIHFNSAAACDTARRIANLGQNKEVINVVILISGINIIIIMVLNKRQQNKLKILRLC